MASEAHVKSESAIFPYYENNMERLDIYHKNLQLLSRLEDKCSIIPDRYKPVLGETEIQISTLIPGIVIKQFKRFKYKTLNLQGTLSNELLPLSNTINQEIKKSYFLSQVVRLNISPHFYLFYGVLFCRARCLLYEQCNATFATYLLKNKIKNYPKDSFDVQLYFAQMTTKAYGFLITDLKPENYMYISVNENSYLYYILDKMHIYVKTYGKLWVQIDYEYTRNVKAILPSYSNFEDYKRKLHKEIVICSDKPITQSNETKMNKNGTPVEIVVFNTDPYTIYDSTIEINKLVGKYENYVYNGINYYNIEEVAGINYNKKKKNQSIQFNSSIHSPSLAKASVPPLIGLAGLAALPLGPNGIIPGHTGYRSLGHTGYTSTGTSKIILPPQNGGSYCIGNKSKTCGRKRQNKRTIKRKY
jgi:hypothetical protein